MLSDEEVNVLIARMAKCRKVITDKHGTAKPKTFTTGEIPCPECGSGSLQYSISNYNGHIHAQCTTKGCVAWAE